MAVDNCPLITDSLCILDLYQVKAHIDVVAFYNKLRETQMAAPHAK
jgi:hypothetical protein